MIFCKKRHQQKLASDSANKAIDVIHSCTRRIHVVHARNYVTNFNNLFNNEIEHQVYLATVFNHKAREFNVKLLKIPNI